MLFHDLPSDVSTSLHVRLALQGMHKEIKSHLRYRKVAASSATLA
jgi:hypothetical protein